MARARHACARRPRRLTEHLGMIRHARARGGVRGSRPGAVQFLEDRRERRDVAARHRCEPASHGKGAVAVHPNGPEPDAPGYCSPEGGPPAGGDPEAQSPCQEIAVQVDAARGNLELRCEPPEQEGCRRPQDREPEGLHIAGSKIEAPGLHDRVGPSDHMDLSRLTVGRA